jgi:hypothetical protein
LVAVEVAVKVGELVGVLVGVWVGVEVAGQPKARISTACISTTRAALMVY